MINDYGNHEWTAVYGGHDDNIIDAVHKALAMLGADQFGDVHEEDDW